MARGQPEVAGQALFLALIVILVLSAMGLGLAYVMEVEWLLAVNNVKQSAVFYAAESGLEYAAARLVTMPGKSYHGGPMPVPMSTGRGAPGDIEIIVNDPRMIREENVLADDGKGGQIGVTVTTYHVVSTAQSTQAQIVSSVEADVRIVPGRSSQITEWKEGRRR